jgi:hypothetical protein
VGDISEIRELMKLQQLARERTRYKDKTKWQMKNVHWTWNKNTGITEIWEGMYTLLM